MGSEMCIRDRVAAGFAVRSKALRDRRAVALMLTEAGETRLSAILQRRNETLSEILSHVSNADRLVLERIAETILAQMSDDAFSALTICLLYTSPSPRDGLLSRMPSSA